MELTFEMTGRMFVAREFRAEIDRGSASLPVKTEHR